MTTPMNYTEVAQQIFLKLEAIEKKISKMAAQVDEIYRDDEPETINDAASHSFHNKPRDDEKVRHLGDKVPYNLIYRSEDIEGFKEFIHRAKQNHQKLTPIELEYVDRADKNFSDYRLSNQHIRILQAAYLKIYNKPWPFKAKMGYMYKLEPYALVWEWF